MIWNYRIIKERDEYYIAEVFYEDGIKGWSEPILRGYESKKDAIKDLKMMLKDIQKPIIEVLENKIIKEIDDRKTKKSSNQKSTDIN